MKTPEFLFRLDPEQAHHLAMLALGPLAMSRTLRRLIAPRQLPSWKRTVFGIEFPNPVGLAAGFDKSATVLPAWEALGFGCVEAGTITAKAQPGNPRPRVFRIREQGALINRFGFNNDGADAVAVRLSKLKAGGRWPVIPIGMNIGKSKVTPLEEAAADYLYSFRTLREFGDYFVLNVSSPNTPGLRKLQGKEALAELLGTLQAENRAGPVRKPLLLKIAPDLDDHQLGEIIELVETHGFAGIVATNTTLDHSSVPAGKDQEGGLSGDPLRHRSTEVIRFITSRSRVPVIGVGGISDAASALEKLDAGAVLIQLYTGFVYRGPSLVREICKALPTPGQA